MQDYKRLTEYFCFNEVNIDCAHKQSLRCGEVAEKELILRGLYKDERMSGYWKHVGFDLYQWICDQCYKKNKDRA